MQLIAYDERWPAAFEVEASRILESIPGRWVEVRHVGSTAVPGLLAKPVIDMLGGLCSFEDVDLAIDELRAIGYRYLPDAAAQSPDRKWLFLQRRGRCTHHMHLVAFGSRAWRDRALFCELLKSDPALRSEYENLKRRLAANWSDDVKPTPPPRSPSFCRPSLSLPGTPCCRKSSALGKHCSARPRRDRSR